MRRPILFLFMGLLVTATSGCAGFSQHVVSLYQRRIIHSQEKHDLADIRQETREELAKESAEFARLDAERRVQMAKYEAQQRHWEQSFCAANQEALQRNIQAQIRESVDSKLQFDVNQGLEIGELEVDVEALKKLIEERDQEAIQRQTEALQGGPYQKGPVQKSCGCDEQECGCYPGRQKKHCSHCRHQACGCPPEPNCGGPEALARLQEPMVRPLKPTEIPLKLPVKLTFGMQNPQIEETKIRREPLTRPYEPLQGPEPLQRSGPLQKDDWEDALQKSATGIPVPPPDVHVASPRNTPSAIADRLPPPPTADESRF